MPNLDSLVTISGLLVFLGVLALLYKRLTPAAVLFIIDGAAGLGVFWERWSRETDHHMRLTAVFDGRAPTPSDWALLGTHLPVLLVGLTVLTVVGLRSGGIDGVQSET